MSPYPVNQGHPRTLRINDLIRPHWKTLAIALAAVLGETVTDVLEPWPIKVVVDNVLQSKKLPGLLGSTVSNLFGTNPYAMLNFAIAAVAVIAVVGALSSYFEKYLTTSVSQWVRHDLRRTLYQHIQRLSLAEHDETRTGDLITPGDERHRSHSGLHHLRAPRHRGQRPDARRHDRRHALPRTGGSRSSRLPIAPVLFVVVYSSRAGSRRPRATSGRRKSELLSIVEEVLSSIRVVQAFAREDYERSADSSAEPRQRRSRPCWRAASRRS